jgi:predicted RNase H-like nuclease
METFHNYCKLNRVQGEYATERICCSDIRLAQRLILASRVASLHPEPGKDAIYAQSQDAREAGDLNRSVASWSVANA